MRIDEAGTAQVEALGELARGALGHLTPEQCLRGEQAIERHMGRIRSSWRVRGLAAALVVAVAIVALVWLRSAPLEYVVENGRVGEGLAIEGQGSVAPMLRFSDGSEVRLAEGARARIRFVTARGAALAIDRGELHAEVVHSASSEWQFDAGPFVVRVTGTSFGMTWNPEQDRLDLRVEHGSVTVRAPVANDPIPVRAGQWLTVRIRSNEVLIRDLPTGAEPPLDAAGAPPQPSAAAVPSAAVAASAASADRPERPRDWAEQLAKGEFGAIIEDAQRRGISASLQQSSAEELAALADAARYTRRSDIAREALTATRRRFPGSRRAVEAAFLLGRLAEAQHSEGAALTFFDTYLSEAPGGTYASEALGRKMAIVHQSRGSATARPLAEDYLARYTNGTYAPAARAILREP
jgi:hypothetical protein